MQRNRERTCYAAVVMAELIGEVLSGDLYGGYGGLRDFGLDTKQETGIGVVTFIHSSAFN